MSAELLKARWSLCEGSPGIILADLGAKGAPDVVAVDLWRELDLSDAQATEIAAHIVALHNRSLAAGG